MSSSPAYESQYGYHDNSEEPKELELPPQSPVNSRLRPRKRKPIITAPPATPIRRARPSKRVRKRRNSSSPPALSSPYRLIPPIDEGAISSPYQFDHDFYHERSILNGNVDSEAATYGAANNRHKKHLREAHEKIIDSAVLEQFTPLDMPDPPRPLRAFLPDSAKVNNPGSFFDLFLKDDDFEMIATNTNKYAEAYPMLYPRNSARPFKPTCRAEIKIYFAILIFLGIYKHNNPKAHWDAPLPGSPVDRMPWKRYEHLKSIIKVSDINQDRQHADIPGDWHFKISPLDERLMSRFQEFVIPGSKLSYDEQMLPFRGRSTHVTKVPGKPHPDGFKVWALCDHGYIYDWLYFSGSAGMLFY